MLARLNAVLDPQIAKYAGQVEKVIHDAGRSMPTGTKRNQLIHQATGEYFCQIDCDDIVSYDYVDKIMEGIRMGVDVITICGKMLTNGANKVDFVIKLGESYEERNGKYYRWPNHLCAFKKELVEKIKFPPVWIGEDFQWSKKVHELGVLKTEHHISKQIYTYEFVTGKPK